MPSNYRKRTPAKKWVARKFSEKRMHAMEPFGASISWKNYEPIFNSAEVFLRMPIPARSRMLFLGQGMRPLFEAIRGINELTKTMPRASIRYIVIPENRKPDWDKSVMVLAKKLEQLKIASKKLDKYFIVDNVDTGVTLEIIKKAILQINPKAEIQKMRTPFMDAGINLSDEAPRPTKKDSSGNLLPREKERTLGFLAFQKALQDYLNKRQNVH